jgi:hypothetical protein
VQEVVAGGIVVVTAVEGWEVVTQWRTGQLLWEEVNLVQEGEVRERDRSSQSNHISSQKVSVPLAFGFASRWIMRGRMGIGSKLAKTRDTTLSFSCSICVVERGGSRAAASHQGWHWIMPHENRFAKCSQQMEHTAWTGLYLNR